MNAFRTLSVWTCALIVALPLKPCAFFSAACCGLVSGEQVAPVETAVAPPQRSCCAEHSESPTQPAPGQKPAEPCSRECCRISPFTSMDQKLLVDAPELTLALALPVAIDSLNWGPAVVQEPSPVSPALQVLHCQWRL